MSTAWRSDAWVEVCDEPEKVAFRICGELDLEREQAIEPVVLAAIEDCSAVTLDLSSVTFCDSSGLALFIVAIQKAEATGSSLTLCNAQPTLLRLIEIAGLRDVITVDD